MARVKERSTAAGPRMKAHGPSDECLRSGGVHSISFREDTLSDRVGQSELDIYKYPILAVPDSYAGDLRESGWLVSAE